MALGMGWSPEDGRAGSARCVAGLQTQSTTVAPLFLLQPLLLEQRAAGEVSAQESDPGLRLSKAPCKRRLMGWGRRFKHDGKHLCRAPFK